MTPRLGLALLLLPLHLAAQSPAPTPVQSALLSVAMPDGTKQSNSFIYRAAAKYSLKLDADKLGIALGQRIEMFQLAKSAPPQADIVAGIESAGWTVTINPALPTAGLASKAGSPSVLIAFEGSRDRWVYTSEVSQSSAPPTTATGPVTVATNTTQPAQTPPQPTTDAGATQPPPAAAPPAPSAPATATAPPAGPSTFAFHTTNFDDGWTSTIGDDYVTITKGDLRIVQHYKREEESKYMSVIAEETTLFWNLLVAPRYRDVTNLVVEQSNPGGYQPINYAEAEATDIATGRRGYIVLFNHPNRNSRWMEFMTPDKATFEREFGPYRGSGTEWDRWLAMAGRNRFGVSASDFSGTWSDSFASGTGMVYAATGRSAGMLYAGGSTEITFNGAAYREMIAGAEGMVGSIRQRTVEYTGAFTVLDNWTVSLANNFAGRTRRFHAAFQGVKGGRVLNLVLDEPGAPLTLHLVRVR